MERKESVRASAFEETQQVPQESSPVETSTTTMSKAYLWMEPSKAGVLQGRWHMRNLVLICSPSGGVLRIEKLGGPVRREIPLKEIFTAAKEQVHSTFAVETMNEDENSREFVYGALGLKVDTETEEFHFAFPTVEQRDQFKEALTEAICSFERTALFDTFESASEVSEPVTDASTDELPSAQSYVQQFLSGAQKEEGTKKLDLSNPPTGGIIRMLSNRHDDKFNRWIITAEGKNTIFCRRLSKSRIRRPWEQMLGMVPQSWIAGRYAHPIDLSKTILKIVKPWTPVMHLEQWRNGRLFKLEFNCETLDKRVAWQDWLVFAGVRKVVDYHAELMAPVCDTESDLGGSDLGPMPTNLKTRSVSYRGNRSFSKVASVVRASLRLRAAVSSLRKSSSPTVVQRSVAVKSFSEPVSAASAEPAAIIEGSCAELPRDVFKNSSIPMLLSDDESFGTMASPSFCVGSAAAAVEVGTAESAVCASQGSVSAVKPANPALQESPKLKQLSPKPVEPERLPSHWGFLQEAPKKREPSFTGASRKPPRTAPPTDQKKQAASPLLQFSSAPNTNMSPPMARSPWHHPTLFSGREKPHSAHDSSPFMLKEDSSDFHFSCRFAGESKDFSLTKALFGDQSQPDAPTWLTDFRSTLVSVPKNFPM